MRIELENTEAIRVRFRYVYQPDELNLIPRRTTLLDLRTSKGKGQTVE